MNILTKREMRFIEELIPRIEEAIDKTGVLRLTTAVGRGESARQSIMRRVLRGMARWLVRRKDQRSLPPEEEQEKLARTGVKNAARDLYRAGQRDIEQQKEHLGGRIAQMPATESGSTWEPADPHTSSVGTEDEYRQLFLILHDHEVLSEEQRHLIHLIALVHNGSLQRTAEALGITYQAVQNRLGKIRTRLQHVVPDAFAR